MWVWLWHDKIYQLYYNQWLKIPKVAKVRVFVGLQHTNVVDLGHVEGEKNLIDHEIIVYTNE